jgi:flagellar biogenesis protein FliO
MSGKTNSKTRQTQLSSQMEGVAFAAAIAQENPIPRLELHLSTIIEQGLAGLTRAWRWVQARSKTTRRSRKLRVCESAQLGEKRFVALIQADGQRFLIGGTSTSISLLATLPSRKNFRSLLPKEASFEVTER